MQIQIIYLHFTSNFDNFDTLIKKSRHKDMFYLQSKIWQQLVAT